MKTTEIMKIEYLEPVVRVKEVSRRRCVVANSAETTTEGYSESVLDTDDYSEKNE